jgi:hypothetical protein
MEGWQLTQRHQRITLVLRLLSLTAGGDSAHNAWIRAPATNEPVITLMAARLQASHKPAFNAKLHLSRGFGQPHLVSLGDEQSSAPPSKLLT